MDWVTVYDFGNEFPHIFLWLVLISFTITGYGIAIFRIFSNKPTGRKRSHDIGFAIALGSFSLYFCIVDIPSDFSRYSQSKEIYQSKKYLVIEGIVENFDPMPHSGHKDEKFTLNGVKFHYSDYDKTYYGFNNTKSHGGPIDEGKRFRLSYFESDNRNIILKIEIPK